MYVKSSRVWSLTARSRSSNDGPGQDMFDEAPSDGEGRKLYHAAEDRQSLEEVNVKPASPNSAASDAQCELMTRMPR